MNSDDEFAGYHFSDFTEDDFAQIDALTASAQSSKQTYPTAEPTIVIEMESQGTAHAGGKADLAVDLHQPREIHHSHKKSFFEAFRNKNTLSVTDLTAPGWCEVQYEYGLLQRRSRPIGQRPKSFLSAEGKKISVKTEVAENNDRVTSQGKVVHKQLEREVYADKVFVRIESGEEQWGLRLVNAYICMRTLLFEGGLTREMPVFGMLQGEVIIGVIDEIALVTAQVEGTLEGSDSPSELEKPERQPAEAQRSVGEFSGGDASGTRQRSLHLSDSKTRRIRFLPSEDDAKGSRLQLMLYHRLLKELLATSPPFDFSELWEKLDLDPEKPFSSEFLFQTNLDDITSGPRRHKDFKIDRLSGWAQLWHGLVDGLEGITISSNLKLVYRSIPEGKRRRRQEGRVTRRKTMRLARDDIDLARAIEASLQESNPTIFVDSLNGLGAIQDGSPGKIDPISILYDVEDVTNAGNTSGDEPSIDHQVIGTTEFPYDGSTLDEHLGDALDWWHGRRKSRGVSVEHSRRCFTCEYCDDCEWRTEKAAELGTRTHPVI